MFENSIKTGYTTIISYHKRATAHYVRERMHRCPYYDLPALYNYNVMYFFTSDFQKKKV